MRTDRGGVVEVTLTIRYEIRESEVDSVTSTFQHPRSDPTHSILGRWIRT